MEDEADDLGDLCADLVSMRRFEPGLVRLLRDKAPGEWARLEELYAGTAEPVRSNLVAAWLPAPDGAPAYAVVLFYDPETYRSFTAYYNRGRLLAACPGGPAAG